MIEKRVSNSKIAKNTVSLYIRTIVMIVVNIWSIKLLLRTIGTDDYGIYTLIGGLVGMLTFLGNSMMGATQRYLSYEIGRGNEDGLNKVFSISLGIHVAIVALILLIGETFGLWFVNTHLNLPPGSLDATNWMYQSVLLTFSLTVLNLPYNACIVSHERMEVFGYIGIAEVLMKLGIIYIVALLPFERLKSYAVLLVLVSLILRIISGVYCHRHFQECRFRRNRDKSLLKEMLGFAQWTLIGTLGFAARDGGVTIVFDKIFSVAVVAGRGLAMSVSGYINTFASNFTTAINPSIIKCYAAGEIEEMMKFVRNGCKYTLLLASFVIIPLGIGASLVYDVWLKHDVPPYSVEFLQLSMVMVFAECILSPLTTALQATGKIRLFQILICIIMTANVPLAWFLANAFPDPYIIYVVLICTSALGIAVRLRLLHGMVKFSYMQFVRTVYFRTVPALIPAGILSYLVFRIVPYNLFGLIIYGAVSVVAISASAYFLALDKAERAFIKGKVAAVIGKLKISYKKD